VTEISKAADSAAGLPVQSVTINQVVGYNMTVYRKAAGLTQEELGQRLGGWTKVAVSAAERSWDGKRIRKFDADEITQIAAVLGIPPVALFLPPENHGTAVRYVLDAPGSEDGKPADLLAYVVPTYQVDSSAMAAYRKRLIAVKANEYESLDNLETAERILKLLQETADQSINQTRSAADQTLGMARSEADEVLIKARRQAEQITGEARARAESLERDAQERHRKAMGSLVATREELERRVDDLRAFEREYRSRLTAFLESQLTVLRAGVVRDGPRFVIEKDSTGKYHFNLQAANGHVLAVSQQFKTKQAAVNEIAAFRTTSGEGIDIFDATSE
jgi:uncharacterized protein YegP (UPF0339 family)/transcriptional regulator with XRE-family HTH domain